MINLNGAEDGLNLKAPSGEYGLIFVAVNPESFRDLSYLPFKYRTCIATFNLR